MASVSLVLEFDDRVIAIPFRGLEKLDRFTIGYDNKVELFNSLTKLLDFRFKRERVNNIYIQYIVKDKKISILPVKYSQDDFDIDDLKNVYKEYYKDDHTRIKSTTNGIRHVKHETILNYLYNGLEVTNMDIDKAVDSFLKGGYKKYRAAYFTLKKHGYKVKCREMDDEINISKYDSEDAYFQSLLRTTTMDKEDEVIEELSLHDIDDRKTDFPNLFDGTKNNEELDLNTERMVFEELSGISTSELEESINKGRGRR